MIITSEFSLREMKIASLPTDSRIKVKGGDRYSPIDETVSAQRQEVIYDETNPFSKQLPPTLFGHFTISYKINKQNKSHEFAIKVLNMNITAIATTSRQAV
jgi:hypothetical protein